MAYARWERPVQDAAGNLLTNVYCEVRREDVVGTPLATLYSDRDGAVPLGNPFFSASGVVWFHVAGGSFKVRLYKSGYDETFRYVPIGTAQELDQLSGVPVLTVSQGIAFPATQNPSSDPNTLDDYEEGNWVPVFTFGTPGNLSITYSVQAGTYTKVGRMVNASFNIVSSAFTHTTASGNATITGLPFAASSATGLRHYGVCQWSGITKPNYTQINPKIEDTSPSSILFSGSGSGQAGSNPNTGDIPTGGTLLLRGSLTYHV